MTVPDDTKVLKELTRAIHRQNNFYRAHQVIVRGFINGIFTALGATIGFTLFIVIAGWFITITGDIPIVSYILKETRLDVLIENQLKQIEQSSDQDNPSPTPPLTPTPEGILPEGETGSGASTN